MRVLVLDAGIFPDRETIEAALARLGDGNEVRRVQPTADASDSEWDRVLSAIRAADLVVTV
jgi:hypothetical protein